MPKFSILFCRFPFFNSEVPDSSDWMIDTILKAKADPRIGRIGRYRVDDTPITASRNRALKKAAEQGFDFTCMIDADMNPDAYLAANPYRLGTDPLAKPFWDTAFDFAIKHHGPCTIFAPYCGPPPHENIYVFRWANRQSDHPDPGADMRLEQFAREEASQRTGIEHVGGGPTGLILIDMRAIARLPMPWFDYDWDDAPCNSKRASTEDVFFTRNLNLVDVPQYCTWDCWAGHWKRKCVGKPTLLTSAAVKENFRQAVLANHKPGERLLMVGEGTDDEPFIKRALLEALPHVRSKRPATPAGAGESPVNGQEGHPPGNQDQEGAAAPERVG